MRRHYIPNVIRKKWIPNPIHIAANDTEIIESLIDISLPYLVYTANTIKDTNPIIEKTQANIQTDKEGISKLIFWNKFSNIFFRSCI